MDLQIIHKAVHLPIKTSLPFLDIFPEGCKLIHVNGTIPAEESIMSVSTYTRYPNQITPCSSDVIIQITPCSSDVIILLQMHIHTSCVFFLLRSPNYTDV